MNDTERKSESPEKPLYRRLKIADWLDATKWGQDFQRPEIEKLAGYLVVNKYNDGDTIFTQGDHERSMAFIAKGEVEIVKDSGDNLERIVVTLSTRSHFGEMALLDDEPRSATAVALGETVLLVLTHEAFENILEQDPKMGVKMLKKIAAMISKRLRATTGKLVYTRS